MIWSLILPFKITCVVLVVLVILANVVAPLLRWKRLPVLGLSLVAAAVAFLPSFLVIMGVVDLVRFGTFYHSTFDEVDDPLVELFLPPDATDITIYKNSVRFRARYTISQADLTKHVNSMWAKHRQQATNTSAEATLGTPSETTWSENARDPISSPPLTNPLVYEGPVAVSGAGFTIWYSVEDGVAYQEANYW